VRYGAPTAKGRLTGTRRSATRGHRGSVTRAVRAAASIGCAPKDAAQARSIACRLVVHFAMGYVPC
jgi:hypothetical protein